MVVYSAKREWYSARLRMSVVKHEIVALLSKFKIHLWKSIMDRVKIGQRSMVMALAVLLMAPLALAQESQLERRKETERYLDIYLYL